MLRRLQRDNQMMVLMISHDRREIAGLADRVVEIRGGRNVLTAAVAEWQSSVKLAD